VQGDVLDLAALAHAIRQYRIERIIHLAGILFGENNPLQGLRVNTEGTIHVLEAARLEAVTRVTFTSAKAAYGQITGVHGHPDYTPLAEDQPAAPDSVYGFTKLAAEHAGLHYARRFGVDFVALRLSSLYGPGRLAGRHGALPLVDALVVGALRGEPVHIPRGGEQREDYMYNRDLARGVVQACFAERLQHRVYNLGSGRGVTLHEVAAAVKRIIPEANLSVGDGLDPWGMGKMYYSVLDTTRAREDFAFAPQYDLDAGIRDYVDVLRRLG
jgi:UDP-glucose 4-epimerase